MHLDWYVVERLVSLKMIQIQSQPVTLNSNAKTSGKAKIYCLLFLTVNNTTWKSVTLRIFQGNASSVSGQAKNRACYCMTVSSTTCNQPFANSFKTLDAVIKSCNLLLLYRSFFKFTDVFFQEVVVFFIYGSINSSILPKQDKKDIYEVSI